MKANVSIAISDPWLQKLVRATESISVKGRGELRPGRYKFRDKNIEIPSGTKFELAMSIDFDGQAVVNAAGANGLLTLSQAINFEGIPLPTKVQLQQGEATVEMDFARTLFAAIINQLQQHHPDSAVGGMQLADMPMNVQIEEAKLKIRKGGKLDFAGLSADISDGSYLLLEKVAFTSKTEYKGSITVSLAIGKDSHFTSSSVSCGISSGEVHFHAEIACRDKTLKIEADDGRVGGGEAIRACTIALNGCTFKSIAPLGEKPATNSTAAVKPGFSGTPESSLSASCSTFKISVSKLLIVKSIGQTFDPEVKLTGVGVLSGARFDLRGETQGISGALPAECSGAVSYEISGSRNNARLAIDKSIVAENLHWAAKTDGNDVDVTLRQASVEHITADTASGITADLESASVKPAKLSWKNGKRSIELSLDLATRLSTTGPLRFSFQADKVVTPTAIPLKLAAGEIDIRDKKNNVYKLKGLSGTCLATIAGKNVSLDGELSTRLSAGTDIFGIQGFKAQIARLKIRAAGEHGQLQLNDCVLFINMNDLKAALRNNLPDPYERTVDEILLDKKKWRYKNFRIKKVTVRHPSISQLDFQGINQLSVKADADLDLTGDVEVYSQKLNPFSKTPSQWKIHPWSASAHVREDGLATYKLLAGNSLSDSKIHLDTRFKIGYPDRIDFDWSKVAGDTLAKAENKILQAAVISSRSFAGDKTLTVDYSGDVSLFRRTDARLRSIQMKKLSVSPQGKDLAVKFSGALSF